jgi:hypothetical protein
LLYNLFGSIDNQQSLIFTHEDLIQYLFSIIQLDCCVLPFPVSI